MEELNFDLERQEKPVTIGGEKYVLIELDGKQRDKYLDTLTSRVRVKDGKPQGLKSFDKMHADLVAASLRKIDETGGHELVSVETIQSWPAKVSSALFDAAQELSGLNESGEDDEGNE